MPRDRRTRVVAGVTVAAVVALAVLWQERAVEVGAALSLFPLWALAACVTLHLLTLLARSEAWTLALTAVDGRPPPRDAVHAANAGAFCCGALMAHCAMPARIVLLRRLAGGDAPRPGQVAVADVPIVLLEMSAIAVVLVAAGYVWAAPAIVAPLLAGRVLHDRAGHLRSGRGLRALGDRRLAARLAAWVAVITLLGVARVWLTLSLLHLPAGREAVAATFASLGAFGLLPLGPAAPAAGTLAASGGADIAHGLAAGAVVAATSLIAVATYAGVVALGMMLAVASQTSAGDRRRYGGKVRRHGRDRPAYRGSVRVPRRRRERPQVQPAGN